MGLMDKKQLREHQKSVAGNEEQIIALYAKGMTARDIQDWISFWCSRSTTDFSQYRDAAMIQLAIVARLRFTPNVIHSFSCR